MPNSQNQGKYCRKKKMRGWIVKFSTESMGPVVSRTPSRTKKPEK